MILQWETYLKPSRLVLAPALRSEVEGYSVSLLFSGHKVDVVGDQKLSNSGDGTAPRRYEGGGSEVRSPLWLLQFLLQSFIFTCSDLHQQLVKWGRHIYGMVVVSAFRG